MARGPKAMSPIHEDTDVYKILKDAHQFGRAFPRGGPNPYDHKPPPGQRPQRQAPTRGHEPASYDPVDHVPVSRPYDEQEPQFHDEKMEHHNDVQRSWLTGYDNAPHFDHGPSFQIRHKNQTVNAMAEEYDPVIDDIRETLREIYADYAEAKAQYERASIDGDEATRRTALRQMGHYQTEYNNAATYGNQYWASKQPPPAPPPLSKEELAAKPMDRMTHQDMFRILQDHYSGKGDAPPDPGFAQRYAEGMNEVARRRARGE